MHAYIKLIEFYLPEKIETNEDIVRENPEWNIKKISAKTGIKQRHIAATNETSLDMAVKVGNTFFSKNPKTKDEIDYLIFCTQSPDHFLPTSACIIQNKLGLNNDIGAIDVNQGCSGFVYSIGLAKGLIESKQASNVLLITSETYSKFINKSDKSVRTLFGDGSTCTLISSTEDKGLYILPVLHGTDGSGSKDLIVPDGGLRSPINNDSFIETADENNNIRSKSNLFMNGKAVYSFTLNKIPDFFRKILKANNVGVEEIDLFIFHQANQFIIDSLKKNLEIDESKIHRSYENIGNTVSSTIPIGIKLEIDSKRDFKTKKALILGFGVGLSWAGTIITF